MSGNSLLSAASQGASDRAAALLEAAQARIGQLVGKRWKLEAVLGLGGTAVVYRAVHRNGRVAALKVLHAELALNRVIVRRFLSEGYAANRVNHPGSVLVLDDGEDAGTVFLVLELLEGMSLAEQLSIEGPLPVADVVRASLAVLDVLASAHEQGVVHRDIKPSNIFAVADGSFKVLDFGVARIQEPDASQVTLSGFTVGTPAFMAPELAAGRFDEVDGITDIWAVGASMFQLLTGRLVHEASSVNAAIIAGATQHVAPIRTARRDLPSDVAAIVDRALAFRRSERWPNARAMRRALVEAMPGVADAPLGLRATDPDTVAEAPARVRPTQRWRERRVGSALAVGAALVGIIWLGRNSGESVAPTSASTAGATNRAVVQGSTQAVTPNLASAPSAITASSVSPVSKSSAPPLARSRPRKAEPPRAPRFDPNSFNDEERILDRRK